MEGYICIKTNFFDKVKYPFSIVKQENLVHLYFIISAKTGAKTNSFLRIYEPFSKEKTKRCLLFDQTTPGCDYVNALARKHI